jgi:hypothetical protein
MQTVNCSGRDVRSSSAGDVCEVQSSAYADIGKEPVVMADHQKRAVIGHQTGLDGFD